MQCSECGSDFTPRQASGHLCGSSCAKAWNNRRLVRGALLYDLVMANRFDRTTARSLRITSAVNRLASVYREQDRTGRGGRRSWRAPDAVVRGAPWLVTGEGRV